MSKTVTIGLSLAVGLGVGLVAGSRFMSPQAEAQMAAQPVSSQELDEIRGMLDAFAKEKGRSS